MFTKLDSNKAYNLALSWILVSAIYFANKQMDLVNLQSVRYLAIIIFVIAVFSIWLLINRMKDQRVVQLAMIVFSTLYFTAAAVINREQFFAVGLCIVLGIIILSTDIKGIRPRIGNKSFRRSILFLSLLFVVLVGGNCCLIYINHWTACYDFGIFSQMFHYMKEIGIPFTTCERDELMSHFSVHMSPIYYLILPFYYLFPSPITLELMQSLIVMSGLIPLVLIMRKHSLNRGSMIFFSLIYLFFPGFVGGCFYHLHENCFLAPLALWLIYFCEKELWYGQALFSILLLAVKEDAAVYVAVIALYFLFTCKNYKCNLCIVIVSIAYFVGITRYLSTYGDGVMMYRYDNYLQDGEGALAILSTAISDPVYVISQISVADKLKFMFLTLMPMGFLPIITKDYKRAILMLPWILINLMPNYHYQYDMRYQYCFGTCAILIYLSVLNYADLKEKHRDKLLLYGACCTIVICSSINYDHLGYIDFFNRSAEKRAKINYAVSLVPEEASVTATTFFVTDFSNHDVVYELERTENETEYYIVDLRQDNDKYSVDDYLNDDYETLYYEPDVVAVFKRLD